MADNLNTVTSTASTGTSTLSFLPTALQSPLNNLTSTLQSNLDHYLPASRRADLKSKLQHFANTRPLLASFLLSQIALSGLPLALFLIMSVTVVIFALLTGILVGLIGALLFIVCALGFALVILLPTLFVTTFSAVAVWMWGVGAYYIVKWFNEKKVPGVHRPLGEGLMDEMGLGDLSILKRGKGENGSGKKGNGDAGKRTQGSDGAEREPKKGNATETASNGHHVNGNDNASQGETKNPVQRKKVEKLSIKSPAKGVTDATEGVTDVGKGVIGVVS